MKLRAFLLILTAALITSLFGCEEGGGGTSLHSVNRGGRMHGAGLYNPTTADCATSTCHGSSLQGGDGPSCTGCHGQFWNSPGTVPSTHNLSRGAGAVMHHKALGTATDMAAEVNTRCVNCHGADLQGNPSSAGTTVNAYGSCFQCHGRRWQGAPPGNHMAVGAGLGATGQTTTRVMNNAGTLVGAADIRHNNAVIPLTPKADCSGCHGTNLDGMNGTTETATSCYLCHNKAGASTMGDGSW